MKLYRNASTGEVISENSAFSVPNEQGELVKYPRGWLLGLSASEIAALGFVEYTPEPEPELPPTASDVDAERDRRVLEGSTFDITDYGSVRILGDEVTIRNLQGLAFAAQVLIADGNPDSITEFRDADNIVHQLTQPQVIELHLKGAAFISACFKAGWTLKDGEEIPADFAEDKHWP